MIHHKSSAHKEASTMFNRRPHSFIPSFIIILLLMSVVYVLYLNNTLQAKVYVIEAKARRYKSQHQSLTSRLQVISEERSSLENSLDEAKAAHAQLNDEMQQNKEVHDNVVEELYNKHQSKYQSLLEQHDDVKEELSRAKEELDEVKEAKQLLEQKSLTHQQLVQSQETKRKMLEEENDKLLVQYNQLSEQHKRNNEFLKQVNSRLQTKEEEVQTYNKLKNVLQQTGIHAFDLQHSRFNEMSDEDRNLLLLHLGRNPALPGQRSAQQPQIVGEPPNQVVQDQQQRKYEALVPKLPIGIQDPSVNLQEKQAVGFQHPQNVPNQDEIPIKASQIGNQLYGGVPQGAVKEPQEQVEAAYEVGRFNQNNQEGDNQSEEDDFEEKKDSPAIEENVVENNVILEEDSDLEDKNYDNQMDKDASKVSEEGYDAEDDVLEVKEGNNAEDEPFEVSKEGNDAEDNAAKEGLDEEALHNDEDTQREGAEEVNKESLVQMYEVDPDRQEGDELQADNADKEPVFDVAEADDDPSEEDNDEEVDEEDIDANEAATDENYDESDETKDENNKMLQHPDGGDAEEEERPVFGVPGPKSNKDVENYEEEDYEDDNYDEDGKKLAMEDDEKYVQDQPPNNPVLPGEEDYEEDSDDEEDQEFSDADRRHDEAVRLTEG